MANSAHTVQICDYYVDFEDQLGKGAFGIVYKARHIRGGEVAAKKILINEHTGVTAVKEAMNAYNLARQRGVHRNVVEIYQVKHDPGQKCMWVFMEFCALGDLETYFTTLYGFVHSIDARLDIMVQIAEGLTYLHQNNIIHRDIKPENIVVSPGTSKHSIVVKLTDFGLAKFLDPTDQSSAMSSDVGTFAFKAPEFWERDPGVKPTYKRNVDVFATGLTFLAILQANPVRRSLTPEIEGSRDGPGRNSFTSIGKIMEERNRFRQPQINVVVCREGEDPITSGIKHVIQKMICYMPHERLTAQELLEQLTQLK